MSARTDAENRVLNVSELEIVSLTRRPAIQHQSVAQLKALVHRLRKAHGRAKDISARQRREIRGKSDPHGAKRVRDNTGSIAKMQVLLDALQRVDGELSRRERNNKVKPSQAQLSRHALEQKLSSRASQRPDSGRSASEGMRPKKRQQPIRVGTSGKEIGRVSQAGKVAQARKDSRNS